MEKGYAYISTKNERLCIHSRLKKIRFDQGRPHEKSNYKHKENNLEELQDMQNIFYLLKHKTKINHLWLTYIQLTVYICINAEMYVTFKSIFSEQENQTPK